MHSCLDRLSDPVTWIEGECHVKDLISTLVEKITNTPIKTLDGGVETNKWRKVYYEREHSYVTYEVSTQSRAGRFINENGVTSIVYRIPSPSETYSSYKAADGYFYEAIPTIPVGGSTGTNPEYRTGKRISYEPFSHNGKIINIAEGLVTLVDMYPERAESTFINRWEKYQAYIVEHYREDYLGNDSNDENWNYYRLVAPMPDDWTYAIHKGYILLGKYLYMGDVNNRNLSLRSTYTVQHFEFTPTYHRVPERATVALAHPDVYYTRYVYFEKPLNSNNYIKVAYMVDYVGNYSMRELVGEPELSYIRACKITNGIPTIVDEHEAYKAYERQINKVYSPGEYYAIGNSGASFNMDNSLYSYWFFSCNSSLTWLPDKMRDEYSLVRYFISLNNKRILAVLEGDPGYDPDSSYVSFAHIGEFKPLNDADTYNNFAVTVGMGVSNKSLTGFEYKDIDKKSNPLYAQYGKFTSNGMDSISVARGKSGLLYQEYHPSFLTQLPNYPKVGTVPDGVVSLDIREYFQPSQHTDHFHSSPIYLVNGYEGYRGYMDGFVAIHDVGVVDGDELDYHLENYIETYVVFKISTPICFLDKSAAPKNMILAILKEIKRV